MAFYSTSVDENGQETRRTFTARSFTECDTDGKAVPAPNHISLIDKNYKTVRYVNPAAFIEKAPETDNSQESSVHSEENAENSSSNIVPPLDLNSDESFQSTPDEMSSYNKACEVSKIITKPDAFIAWLSAKKKMKDYEMQRKKLLEEEREKEKNEKKRIADEKYREWLARKTRSTNQTSSVITNEQSKGKIDYSKGELTGKESERSLPQEHIEKKFKEWLERKLEKKKLEKLKAEKQLEAKIEVEKDRQEKAKLLYDKWLQTAPIKPKPVPLNRGLLTLKGTVSDIYINPEPWQSSTDIERESDDEILHGVDFVY